MTRRIFISSVQRELAAERKAVVDGVSANPQLARFFSTFDEHGRKVGQKTSKVGAKGKEVGLLRREGRGKGSNWIVVPEPPQPITKPLEPRTKARKPITKRRVSAKKGKVAK